MADHAAPESPKGCEYSLVGIDITLSFHEKILAMDDGTFPALLKTLSDSSEEVSILTPRCWHLDLNAYLEGHQTRFTTSRPNLVELRGKLFQGIHDESVGTLQHRSATTGFPW